MPELQSASFLHAALLPVFLLSALPACAGSLPDQRQQELRHLLHQDCGSCHGMRLTGGLGPALTPLALAGKPRELLVATIRDGRAGTPMPPWRNILSDADISWLVDTITRTGTSP